MVISNGLKELYSRYEIGKLSHSFLIETNNITKALADVKKFIKYINCCNTYESKCKKDDCNLCKLIDLNNLPSLIIIEPDGMTIKKNQIAELEDKFSTKPVYSKYNSYIITNAELMNASAANSILKFLEEPEDNIIGFFITSNKENILDTIISRCQYLLVKYDDTEIISNDILILANDYFKSLINGKGMVINKELMIENNNDRLFINNFLIVLLDLFSKEIKNKYFPGNENSLLHSVSKDKLIKAYYIIEKTLHFNQYNVNLELLLDNLYIEMRRTFD